MKIIREVSFFALLSKKLENYYEKGNASSSELDR